MSQETLKRLVGALIVAVVLWGVLSLASGSGYSGGGASGGLAALVDDLTDTASIEAIRFGGADGDAIELAREGGRWTVNGMAADSGSVVRMLEGMAGASLGDVAARNPANHARMGLDAEGARTVELVVAGTARAVLVGDQGPRFGTTYVRLPDEDEVHVLEADLRSHARRSLADWRSKRVFAVDTAEIATLEIVRDGDGYALERADSAWVFADGMPADGGAVRGVLGEVRDLRADGFLAEGDSAASTPPGGRLVLRGTGGEALAELDLGSGTGDRWARVSGSGDVFRIASYRLDRIVPSRERVTPSG